MRPRRALPVRPISPQEAPGQATPVDVSSYLSYALLILYVLASVSATKDEMLLIASNGIELPLVGVTVSVSGFYFLCPIIVLIGHLVTLRRLPGTFANHFNGQSRSSRERLDDLSDRLMLFCLLLAGPLTLLLITFRFAAYQSPIHFLFHAIALLYSWEASIIRYSEIMHDEAGKLPLLSRIANESVSWVLLLWLLICADVILMPAKYSVTLALKKQSTWLTNADGGTVPWVPHISIDRATQLWNGTGNIDAELVSSSGHSDSRQWFMSRGVALDLRGRNLRFLDISQQVIPRVWAHDADLSGANLSHSRLYGALFVNTELRGVNLELTSLDGASFMNTVFEDIEFRYTMLRGTYWDNVTVRNSYFESSDLSLATMYGVKFEGAGVLGGDLTAMTFGDTDMAGLEIIYKSPYKVLRADISGDILDANDPVFIVSPDDALKLIAENLCKPNVHPAWEYAWANFMLLRTLMMTVEPESVSAVSKLYTLDQCEGLPQRHDWAQLENEQARS